MTGQLTLRPLVLIPACVKPVEGADFHAVGEKYITAVADASACIPILLPALGPDDGVALLDQIDGVLFTGSPSNVEPGHYGGTPSEPGTLHDPKRDRTTLPLLEAVLERGVPMLCICRGHQELNVVLGGTLHQQVHEVPGRDDHRAPDGDGAAKYRAVHSVRLATGGLLHGWVRSDEAMVNTLHSQAIDRLADRLVVEAIAPDGTIEAVRVADSPGFALGIQWHPEHPLALDWPLSRAIFKAFGDACRARAAMRLHGWAA